MRLTKSPLLRAVAAFAMVAVVSAPAAMAQQPLNFLPQSDNDFGATALVPSMGQKARAVPRDAAAMSWALEADKALDLSYAPHVGTSKQYFVDVTVDDLAKGVPVFTHAPGALIRINPVDPAKMAAIDPSAVRIVTADKRTLTTAEAADQLASPAQLKAAGAPFAPGTLAFRLRAELGAGTFHVSIPALSGDTKEPGYVVHVFDRNSPVTLSLGADRTDYLHGETLGFTARLAGADKLSVAAIDGFVTSPAGRAWPVTFTAGNGAFHATLPLDAVEAPTPGLWEVHVAIQGEADGVAVRRFERVAFGAALPTARFDGSAELVSKGRMAVRFGIEAASPSRFEVRGVLYGTARNGAILPVAVGHSATWIEAGRGEIVLGFDAKTLTESGLRAPFEIRDLRLMDQGTMGLLHRQARGLVID